MVVKVYIQYRGCEGEIGVAEKGMVGVSGGDIQGDMQISHSLYTPVSLH
jgi:hypothetical protein